MPIDATDTHTDARPRINTNFYVKSVDNTNPNAHAYGNVQFIAPPNCHLNIHTDRGYHTLAYRDADGANRNRTDYGHYFTITDADGIILATGVINGLNFDICSIGVNPTFPEPPPEPKHRITSTEQNDM